MKLEYLSGERSSVLRERFESYEGDWSKRSIDIHKVPKEVVDLEEIPNYVAHLSLIQMRKLDDDFSYNVFVEYVFTNNAFLNNLEDKLRSNAIDVQAEGSEDVPEKYKTYFNTPFSLFTCDFHCVSPSVRVGNQTVHTPDMNFFKGVDFSVPATLRLILPDTIDAIMSDIEKQSGFVAKIKKCTKGDLTGKFLALEYRHGSEYLTVEHIVIEEMDSQ